MLIFFLYNEEDSNRVYCFFFQAEDGIRDKLVTGVQTCALPICRNPSPHVCLLTAKPAPASYRPTAAVNTKTHSLPLQFVCVNHAARPSRPSRCSRRSSYSACAHRRFRPPPPNR